MVQDHVTDRQAETTSDASLDRDTDRQVIEDLMDKVEGLEADLDNAVEVAVSRGAIDWARLNYPGHVALKTAGPQMSIATSAGLSALKSVLSEHRLAASAAARHLSGIPSPGGFSEMSDEEIEDFRAFHARAAQHMEDVIAGFETDMQAHLEAERLTLMRKVAEAERKACESAVAVAWAPVTGTPYITGSRKFCEAIRKMAPVTETSVTPVLEKTT